VDPFAVSGPNGFDVSLENLVEATVGRATGADRGAATVIPFRKRKLWQRVMRAARRR